MEFKFCPECGRRLLKKEIGDEGEVPYCESCGRPFFSFSYPCVICLVTDGEGSFTLLKQGYVSKNYVFVAGYIQRCETPEAAAAREIKEEIGLDAVKTEYLGSFYHKRDDNLMLGFAVTVRRGKFSLSKEVDSAEWFTEEKARELLQSSTVCKELLNEYTRKK